MTLTPPGEPGQPMEISGTVYRADGKTPASGITMFVYHTDATGHYDPQDDPFAPRLRGWLQTGSDRRYSFRSIRPAPYPNHSEPVHIHVHIWSDTMPEHFLPEYWSSNDPLIKPRSRALCEPGHVLADHYAHARLQRRLARSSQHSIGPVTD